MIERLASRWPCGSGRCPHLPLGHSGETLPNVLRFGLDPEGLAPASTYAKLTLSAQIDPPEVPAYGPLLLDVPHGDAALSIRGDEAEEAGRVLTPVLSAWSKDLVPLEEYPAGSDGPAQEEPEHDRSCSSS